MADDRILTSSHRSLIVTFEKSIKYAVHQQNKLKFDQSRYPSKYHFWLRPLKVVADLIIPALELLKIAFNSDNSVGGIIRYQKFWKTRKNPKFQNCEPDPTRTRKNPNRPEKTRPDWELYYKLSLWKSKNNQIWTKSKITDNAFMMLGKSEKHMYSKCINFRFQHIRLPK